MPRYFLNIRVGDQLIEDPEGVVVPSVDATLTFVVGAAQELLAEGLLERDLTDDDRFEVTDADGTVLGTVPLTRDLPSGVIDLGRLTGFSNKPH